MNSRICLITNIDFWRQGAGCRARTLELIKELAVHFDLHLLLCMSRGPADQAYIKRLDLKIKVEWISTKVKHDVDQISIHTYIRANNIGAAIVRSLGNLPVIESLPANIIKIVDVDDLMSEINESRFHLGLKSESQMNFSDEVEMVSKCDIAFFIRPDHLEKFSKYTNNCKLIYCPHPISPVRAHVRKSVKSVGMLANAWHANIDGLQWFLKNVWSQITIEGLQLNIFGHICGSFDHRQKNVSFFGAVKHPVDAYQNIDIGINPVRYGSGLKIKTLECIAHGIPVVCTPEGAAGISCINDSPCLISDNPRDFVAKIEKLACNYELRASLSIQSRDFIDKHFSKSVCFQGLILGIKDALAASL